MSTDEGKTELVTECLRQQENCLYTSTSLYIWKRALERSKLFFAIVPILFSAVVGVKLFTQSQEWWATALVTLGTVVIAAAPAIYIALDLDNRIRDVKDSATIFKNLHDRFRVAANVTSTVCYEEFRTEVDGLFEKMEMARNTCITPPERMFKRAQKKIASGDYSANVDATTATNDVA